MDIECGESLVMFVFVVYWCGMWEICIVLKWTDRNYITFDCNLITLNKF